VIPDYHLLIAYEGAFDPVTEERIEEDAKVRAESYLAFVRKSAEDAGVPCDTLCETSDHPYDAILKAADARRCDLIVMTSHGRKGLAAVLLGSETRKVLTHTRIPVLVVR
jgi:nucleotide-binding universal stress UspA family protein